MDNIALIDGKHAYAGVRPGWHTLGTVVGHAMTSREAMEAAGLANWDLEAVPTFVQLPDGNYIEVPNRRAVLRHLDNHILGTVGNKYTILPNEEAFEGLDSLLADGRMTYETAGALGDGERIWILALIGEAFEVISGDRIEPYLLFTSTHDGSGSALIKQTPTRVVCQNTLNVALGREGTTFRMRHTASIKDRMAEANRMLGIISRTQARLFEYFRRMAETKVTEEVRTKVLNILTPAPAGDESDTVRERLQQQRFALWQQINGASETVKIANPDSMWGLFNAATEWIDWLEVRKGQMPESTNAVGATPWYLRRLEYTAYGDGADRRQKIFDRIRVAMPETA